MPLTAAPHPKQNRILAALSTNDYARLQDDLELVSLHVGQVIYDVGDSMSHVFFPISCLVSLIYTTLKGASAELATTGNEGLVGIPLVLGGDTTTHQVIAQSAGVAYRLKVEVMRWELDQGGDLQHLALRYTQALMTQMAQSVVCNRHHAVDQQLCRFLLLSLDRLPDNQLHLTQELIGSLLGVRREAITEAAGKLQAAGLIHYSRGLINVIDRPGLEARACECYAVVKAEYDRLFQLTGAVRTRGYAPHNPDSVRKRAEARWKQDPPAVPQTDWDNTQLLHELQVHQIELEMHNEALLQAFNEVDALRERYADIYDFAPVSYFTIDPQSVILDLNLSGAILLGIKGSQKGRHQFSSFVAPADRTAFNLFLAEVLQASQKTVCEIVLAATSKRQEATVKIEAIPNEAENECRMVVIDVTAERQAQQALQNSEQRYRGFIEQLPLSLAIIQDGRLQYLNPKCAGLIGYSAAECVGKPFLPMVHEDDRPLVMQAHQTFSRGEPVPDHYEVRLLGKSGRIIECRLHVTTVAWEGRNAALATVEDVTAQKAMEAKLRSLARIDPLTDLSSETHFHTHLALALARLARSTDHESAVLTLSLDCLATINTALGHLASDAALRLFSGLLRAELRDVDIAGRLDGNKIAVLLPESDQAAAIIFAERLRHKVAETSINIGQTRIPITVSTGIAAIDVSDINALECLTRANQALNQAQAAGGNKIAIAPTTNTAQAAAQNTNQGAPDHAAPSNNRPAPAPGASQ